MAIGRILVLPNEVVLPATYEKLINGSFRDKYLQSYPKVNPMDRDEVYGVLFANSGWLAKEVPDDLKKVLQYATEKGIHWIMLDMDNEDYNIDELKYYSEEWDRYEQLTDNYENRGKTP